MDFFGLYMGLFHWGDEGVFKILGTCRNRFELEDFFDAFFDVLSVGMSCLLARGRGGRSVVRLLIYADSHVFCATFRLADSFG